MGILSITDQVRPPRPPRGSRSAPGAAAAPVRGCAAYRAPHRAGPPPQAAGPPAGPQPAAGPGPNPRSPPAAPQRRDPRSAMRWGPPGRSAVGVRPGGGRGPAALGRPRFPQRRPHVALCRFHCRPAPPRAPPGPGWVRSSRSVAAAGGERLAGEAGARLRLHENFFYFSGHRSGSAAPRGAVGVTARCLCRRLPVFIAFLRFLTSNRGMPCAAFRRDESRVASEPGCAARL